ncbi:MAG: hypothetical protein M0026_18500 [Nocardiopsaceae bacterium]|nr:hypothetical protein [Nocardiopsaceae bacterium]
MDADTRTRGRTRPKGRARLSRVAVVFWAVVAILALVSLYAG